MAETTVPEPNFFITGVLAFFMMVVGAIFGTVIVMPFAGAIVRLRANYNPRAVGFDDTDNTVGPKLTGIIDTLRRVKRLEGWYGMWKGAYFTFAHVVVISFFSILFVGTTASHDKKKGVYTFPKEAGVGMILFALALMVVSLPLAILTNRAIITPYRLPANIKQTFGVLLSAHERSRPWMLYLTPGLLPAVALQAIATAVVAGLWRGLLMGKDDISTAAYWRIAFVVIFQAVSTLWLCPIDVLITKLSVQPNLGGEISVEDPEGDVPEGLRFAGQGEDVVGLRPTTDPYLGLMDAVSKIREEEGWQALYRGWYLTTLQAVTRI